ncbi:hypothetical protein OZH70_27245, partial [Escherichia coli]|uniref:hypothetical protein n=1 Tax=Escherichia coli TaxID=562 RepID=UPI00227EAB82
DVTLYIGGHSVGKYYVSQSTLTQIHLIEVKPTDIPPGQQDVYYTVTLAAGGQQLTSLSVSVAFVHEHVLKAPLITGADANHVVDMSTLTTDYVEMVVPADENRFHRNDFIQGFIGTY